jgi:hypothetical protein
MPDVLTREASMLDLLHVGPHHLRSVQIERDYSDPQASLHYVVTPFLAATFERMTQGLQYCSTARAWRLTGDYGSGKSSFMLAFARFAARQVEALPPSLTADAAPVRLEPVLVLGEREPIGRSMIRALRQTIARLAPSMPRALGRKFGAAEALDVPALLDLVTAVGDWVRSAGAAQGLLIIFDELGKNLEHAAASPQTGDLQLLQDLAEAAARSGAKPLVVVAVLHQAVTSYAQELSSLERREWEKVSGRLEEIVFAPPLEQSAALTAAALGLDAKRVPKRLASAARAQMRSAVEAGWYGPGANPAALEALAAGLAPLDAFVLPVLSRLLRRFGQNERSLFSFLSSSEPGGLLAHAAQDLRQYRPYRLHHLYDYMAENLASTLMCGPSGVRWNLVDGVVRSSAATSDLERAALKAVGLINLLDDPGLALTPSMLPDLLSDRSERSAAEAAVARLQSGARVLYDRGAGGGLCLWPHTSVDLQDAFEKGMAAAAQRGDVIAALRPVLPADPLVARRHYITSGTMRHFEPVYVPVAALAEALRRPIAETSDGRLLVVMSRTERERSEALALLNEHPDWPRTLVVGVPPTVGDIAPLLRDLDAWTWVANETPALSGDRLAREEVSRQIAIAEDRLRRALSALLDFKGTGSFGTRWFHAGASLGIHSGRQLTEALSDICDAAFDRAPIITNELLNRRQLSSAAARARGVLIEAVAQAPDKPLLGLDPKHMPPEMSAYLSILRAGNVHVERDERWQVVRPAPDPLNLAPALDCIGAVLRAEEDRRVPYLEVAEALRGPHYGIRDGLIPLFVAIYLAAYWHHTAIYEEGTYLEQVGGPEFMRILKEPEHFTLQHCAVEGVRTVVFSRLASAVGISTTQAVAPDLLDVVRPLLQFVARLPDHARRTRNLSVTAASVRGVLLRVQDPSAMLFRDLPRACGLDPFSAEDPADEGRLEAFASAIASSVRELRGAYPALLDRIAAALAQATEVSGGTETLQDVLASRAEPLVASVAEPELKSLAMRFADRNLSSKLWLESVASFLARKPPERWAETDEREFHHRLKLLSRRFIRVEAALNESAAQLGAPGDAAYRLVITAADGRELEDLVRGDASDANVVRLEAEVGALIDAHGRSGLLAVARALLSRAPGDGPEPGAAKKVG